MSGTTSVPRPLFGPTGFIAPAESAILAGVQADINAAFGGAVNFTTQTGGVTNPTPQGQLAASEAAIIADSYDQFVYYTNQVDPSYASGRMQDGIARIYFINRNPALPTVVAALCTGLANVIIPTGARATDTENNLYICTSGGTIPAGGSITLQFANVANGPIPCPLGALTTISQAIFGWDTIINLAPGVLGEDVETQAAFEARRQQSVAANSLGMLASILGAVLAVPGVLDAYATENPSGAPATIGGVSIPAHSLYVAVAGGSAQAIANAIWSKKAPGCGYTGTNALTVLDTNSGYSPPYPSYIVSFTIPTAIPVLFFVTIANSLAVPSNALALIQGAIIAAFAGVDGGLRARIGSTIFASRFYCGIAALGAWAQIISIQIAGSFLSTTAGSASFTGSISATTLTTSGTILGTIAIGQLLTGPNVAPNTVITAGGGTSWTVTPSQTAASEAMVCYAAGNSISMTIAQVPVTSAANITLTLQ